MAKLPSLPDPLQTQLSKAIVDKTVAEFAKSWLKNDADQAAPEQAQNIRHALAAVARISGDMVALKSHACQTLAGAGISATPITGPEDTGALQYQMVTIQLSAADIARAVDVLGGLGFVPPWPVTAGRAAALARYENTLHLVRYDDETTRIALHFAPQTKLPLPTALRPRHADIACANLPAWAAPGYVAVRAMRLIKERVTGSRTAAANTDFLGTPTAIIEPIFDLLGLSPDQTLVDLGCGDGRIVVAAAKRGCRAIGVESNPDLAQLAKSAIAQAGLTDRAQIVVGQAETADLAGADVVFIFLPSHITAKLLPMIMGKMKAPARIIMHEQTQLPAPLRPSYSVPVIGENALSVAHIWEVN